MAGAPPPNNDPCGFYSLAPAIKPPPEAGLASGEEAASFGLPPKRLVPAAGAPFPKSELPVVGGRDDLFIPKRLPVGAAAAGAFPPKSELPVAGVEGNAPKISPPFAFVFTGSAFSSFLGDEALPANSDFYSDGCKFELFKFDEFCWNNPTCTILLSLESFAPIFLASATTWLNCSGTLFFEILLFSSFFPPDLLPPSTKVFSNLSFGYSVVMTPVLGLCLLILIIFLLAIYSGESISSSFCNDIFVFYLKLKIYILMVIEKWS